jgi:prepilin-type N-terminal cleavage/methylation domain-containing protein/prepilin-type processing-associated H-X9-DG protein
MKKAFTLIELLVVIAIIAILAAILFPVFAQAKLSAKKIASVSNTKQQSLGILMYEGDADDTVPMSTWNAQVGGALTPLGEVDWPQAVQPYIKNWQLFRDPGQMLDPLGVWTAGPYDWYYNWMRWTEFGYNVDYMNNAGGTCANWDYAPGITSYGPPISATSMDAPADTVLLTTTKVVGIASAGAYISNQSESPGSYNASDTCSWSNGGWGLGSYGDTTTPGWYPGNPTYTGTFSIRYSGGGNVSFNDGHSKFMLPGNLAVGTDWHTGVSNTAIHILDKTKYLWSTTKS